ADATNGDNTGYVNVPVGSNPTVGETAGTSSDLTNYEASITCTGGSSVSSNDSAPLSLGLLPAGAVVDCTITNKRKPRVQVTKNLFPTSDPGKFNLQVNGGTIKANATNGDSTGYVNVPVGSSPTVGETAGTSSDLTNYDSS